jgi:hypothetical protein
MPSRAMISLIYDAIGNRTQAVGHLAGTSGTSSPTVKVTVVDSTGARLAGKPVYAFTNGTYSGYNGTTDGDGGVTITLPQGAYRFRADFNGT